MSERELEDTETTINVKSYSQGYKDGYNDAVKFYVTDPYLNTSPDHFKCPVCGMNGMHNMVCYKPNCPSLMTSQVNVGRVGRKESYLNMTPDTTDFFTKKVSDR